MGHEGKGLLGGVKKAVRIVGVGAVSRSERRVLRLKGSVQPVSFCSSFVRWKCDHVIRGE